ncbi:hypothetical protein [Streptosporangium sp. CA-115845]|uniref:hypothetical protein n=1 Tax=Streptosporangium sp. CA-115845 TaxID=3240071 RepID=UPI003D8A947B
MTHTVVPRSCLSVPGVDERKIRKALDSEADEIMLDALRESRAGAVEPDGKMIDEAVAAGRVLARAGGVNR